MSPESPDDGRFEELYQHYRRSVISYLERLGFSRDEANDLAQEAFARVYKNMGQYRGEAKWTFIQKVARNVAYNTIRARKTDKRLGDNVPLETQTELAARGKTPEEKVLLGELGAAIEKLPPSLNAPLRLWLKGFTYDEVASMLKITVDAVKSRLRDARSKLREMLGGVEIESLEDDHDQEK